MKQVLIAIATLFSISAAAQNYGDSLVGTTLTQRAAIFIGYNIKRMPTDSVWNNRTAPTLLKPYVGTGTHPDSLFTVTLKASYITGMIDLLLTASNEVVQADRLSIINNSPSIVGYTALATQIVNLANGNGIYKNVAIYIRDYYNAKIAEAATINAAQKASVVSWANN